MDCIGALGINFKTAGLSLREKLARAVQRIGRQRTFFSYPMLKLSTCNRTELYFCAPDLAKAHSELLSYLRDCIGEEFEHKLYSYFGGECFYHLCKVTAGLDSAIFGESEIQRQVKLAYTQATLEESLPQCIHYAFQKALKVGKASRSRFVIKSPTLFATMWKQTLWQDKKILLIGHSETSRAFASFLQHKGIWGFALSTRDPSMVKMEGVKPYDRSILERWQQFDILVAASNAGGYLIQGEGRKDQVLFDLSVPRIIDPGVGKSATLYNIEQLNETMESAASYSECEAFVREQALRLTALYHKKRQRLLYPRPLALA